MKPLELLAILEAKEKVWDAFKIAPNASDELVRIELSTLLSEVYSLLGDIATDSLYNEPVIDEVALRAELMGYD